MLTSASRNRSDANRHDPGPADLAHDVPLVVMPFATPLCRFARREGCSLRTDTAETVPETKK